MWDAAVYAHADRGDPAAAAAAVDAMRRRRIPVGYVAHGCVVRAFCTADDFEVLCSGIHRQHQDSASLPCKLLGRHSAKYGAIHSIVSGQPQLLQVQ